MRSLSTGPNRLPQSVIPVTLISLFALALALVIEPVLVSVDPLVTDLLVRWRYHLTSKQRRVSGHITLVGIDAETQRLKGRFGSGQWLARKPYHDQLSFFHDFFVPSVLAYDIVLQTMAAAEQTGRISDSLEALDEVIRELQQVASLDAVLVSRRALQSMNALTAEQGDVFLAHQLAAIAERGDFPCLLGYYLFGGEVDRQVVGITPWSNRDVFGLSSTGDESEGERIPYLRDMRIPEADVFFSESDGEILYDHCLNGNLPARDLLDYTCLGLLNGPPDADGVVRRLPLVVGLEYTNVVTRQATRLYVPSLSLAASLFHLGIPFPLEQGRVQVFFGSRIVVHPEEGGEFEIPIDRQGRLLLNYTARLEDFDAISFAEVSLSEEESSEGERARAAGAYKTSVDGRLVFVAADIAGIDVGACPLASRTPLVLTHMVAADNILARRFLIPASGAVRLAVFAILFCGFTALCVFEKATRIGTGAAGSVVLYVLSAYGLIHAHKVVLPVGAPVVYIAIASFGVLSYRFLTEERAKKRIRKMFSTMVSDEVLAFLEENPESFSPRGHTVEATVFFSDVANFTTISEKLPPDRLIDLLNSYLTPVTDNILQHGGCIDKYVGDSVMAIWGAPYPSENHGADACVSAIEQQQLIAEMNARLNEEYGLGLGIRMGINSGEVTAGNMGSERKLQYTVIGDTVNLASRLEPANKDFGTNIIVGEATWKMAREAVEARPLGRILVVGKKEVVSIYELLGIKGEVSEKKLEVAARYANALAHFYERQWEQALRIMDGILLLYRDGPTVQLRERVLFCRENPPGDDWRGEYVRAGKD